MHKGRGGGLSDLFGGGISSSMGGSLAERNLDRLTIIIGVVWLARSSPWTCCTNWAAERTRAVWPFRSTTEVLHQRKRPDFHQQQTEEK